MTFDPQKPHSEADRHSAVARLGAFAVIVLAGVAGMFGLASLKQDPEPRTPEEPVLRTPGMVASVTDAQAILRGFGTARSHRTIEISPEVGGRVIELNPAVRQGNVLLQGDLLFRIDPEPFELRVLQDQAEVDRLAAELERHEQSEQNDRRRLAVARDALELARRDQERVERLVARGGVESESALDAISLTVNQREDAVIALENALALYPAAIGQTRAQLARAEAILRDARRNLSHTEVRAPFTGRIAEEMIEENQILAPNQVAIHFADDSLIEVPVSLDSREVSRWLDYAIDPNDPHWFGTLADHTVTVRWTERPGDTLFGARLARVEKYDARTRTFQIVVELQQTPDSIAAGSLFPVSEGMFCEVEIEGRRIRDVVPIPREAIDADGTVLVVEDGRMKSREIQVSRFQDGIAYVSAGIAEGELVLTARPPRVVDGTRVELIIQDHAVELASRGS